MDSAPAASASLSTLSRLGRRLSLKPYGDELLTRSADFWIFSARLIILAMALAEALAWGYMGALMSQTHPAVTAAIAGVFVFTLIWIIDSSFMTLDLARGNYERALLGKEQSAGLERAKFAAGVLARVAIVSASLVITAPFLAQAIFAGDVRDEMARRNATGVAILRARVDKPFASQIAELTRDQRVLEYQRVREAAGIGPSGKYGRGPALETIERQLDEKRQEIAAAQGARAAALTRFDRLSRAQIENQYGFRFLAPGVRSSSELLDQMMKNPQFAAAELAVRAFLAFLFIGLLILKLFQPRSVAVYFSEQLHSVHDEYRKGLFDAWLPEAERAGAGGAMEALRFEDWCLTTYAAVRREDARRTETAREQRVHELLVEQWRQLGSAARRELEPLTSRHEAALATVDGLEGELHAARVDSSAAGEELRRIEASRESMRKHIERGGMDAALFEQAMSAANDLERQRRALATTIAEKERSIEEVTRRIETKRREIAALDAQIAAQRSVMSEAERRIGEDRMRLAESITRQREAWSGPKPKPEPSPAATESA